MFLLAIYALVTLIAVIWVALDAEAIGAFEIFRRTTHRTARDMGMYWKWLFYSLWRCVLLFSLVALNVTVAWRMLEQNPFGLGPLVRYFCCVAMLAGSFAMIAYPYISARLRFRRLLYSTAAELSELISKVMSEAQFSDYLEPSEFGTADGWTAWHPTDEEWRTRDCWAGIVPVVYLQQEKEFSLIVPVDWECFLAWRIPPGTALRGYPLPFHHGPGEVTSVHKLRGQPDWSVVTTEMDIDECMEDGAA